MSQKNDFDRANRELSDSSTDSVNGSDEVAYRDDEGGTFLRRMTIRASSGPLPDPDTLADFEKIAPGSAQMIFDQFVKQGDHRRELEKKHQAHSHLRSWSGMATGGVVTLSAMALSAFMVHSGQTGYAVATALGPIAGLAGVFVIGKYLQQKDLSNKPQIEQSPDDAK